MAFYVILENEISSETLMRVMFPPAACRAGTLQDAIMGHIKGYEQTTHVLISVGVLVDELDQSEFPFCLVVSNLLQNIVLALKVQLKIKFYVHNDEFQSCIVSQPI